MPHMLSPDIAESSRSRSRQRARTEVSEHRSMWDRLSLQKIGSWLKREEEDPPPALHEKAGRQSDEGNKENGRPHSSGEHAPSSRAGGLLHRRMSSRKVVPGLPRPLTFKRMNSEKRDKLLEVPVPVEQRRAASADRRASTTTKRNLSPPPVSVPSMSAPDVLSPHNSDTQQKAEPTIGGTQDSNIPAGARQVDYSMDESMDYLSTGDPPPLDLGDAYYERDSQHSTSDIDDSQLQEELEAKWILNLSMHFRDMSDREKFFITFAEEPNRWRRVTVSCDYRQLEPDSLEADLKSLHYQRDKSARIYEAIRDSLPDIQFYDTVTNLKLQTSDGRLHVHVTEDVNEIIPYPSLSAVDHLECKKFTENAVCFDSHISGFVYKVSVNNKSYIKKEIPGPDAVEEFLYEINALSNLQDSKSVIKFEGIIIDEKSDVIKGLLISYADQGALVDLVYDYKNTDNFIWERRERWARQIVEGLSEIHEAGFVQGDFTLSNIVIDRNDNAKIIDINRRGCPVGWEPPELARLIESGQRISIYIGVKSDLFQLGMVLWALAEQEDEPERQERPLTRTLNQNSVIPEYFKDIIRACLSKSPKERPAAKDLLARFPELSEPQGQRRTSDVARHSLSTYPNEKAYIDPATAVGLDDISDDCQQSRPRSSFSNVHMPSTEYIRSSGSYILPNASSQRGRSSAIPRSINGARRVSCSPFAGRRSVMSLDDSELENELASLPASRDTRWEQVYVDGDTKLVQRGGGEIDVQDFAHQDPKDVCITTPPGELENSFVSNKTSEDTTPLNLSTVVELQPIQSQLTPSKSDQNGDEGKRKSVGNKASFSDRVHQLAHAHDSSPSSNNARPNSHIPDSITLADLENEIALDSSIYSSGTISRTDTGFSTFDRSPEHPRREPMSFAIANGFHSPPHQDSGFDEGNPVEERVSYESERIRQSLEMSMKDFQQSKADDECVNERLWDEKDGTMIGEGVRGNQLIIKPESIPVNSTTIATMTSAAVPAAVGSKGIISIEDTEDKALEEKTSNTTIRPPSILIPEFHHGVPKAVESLDTNPSAAMQATGSSPRQRAASGQESYKTNYHRPFT